MNKNLISQNPIQKFKQGRIIQKFQVGNRIASQAAYIRDVKSGKINPQESITFIPQAFPYRSVGKILEDAQKKRLLEKQKQGIVNNLISSYKQTYLKTPVLGLNVDPNNVESNNVDPNNVESKVESNTIVFNKDDDSKKVKPNTEINSKKILQTKKLKSPKEWESIYKNMFNKLTLKQIEYLDSLGIDLSSAASIQEGINNYYGKPILTVDNKFGPKSEKALTNILFNMPKDFKSPAPLPPIYYNSGEQLYDNDSAFLRKGGQLISRNIVTRFKKEKINKLLK